jgi:orotate phosphoribosyltransferase-like protein
MARKKAAISVKERATQRQYAAWEYYKTGLSTRQIAEKLGVSHMTVARDVKVVSQRAQDEHRASVWEYVTMENERLDMMLVAIASEVRSGNLRAIDRWLRISASRCRLFGLYEAARDMRIISMIDIDKLTDEQVGRLAAGEHWAKVLFG